MSDMAAAYGASKKRHGGAKCMMCGGGACRYAAGGDVKRPGWHDAPYEYEKEAPEEELSKEEAQEKKRAQIKGQQKGVFKRDREQRRLRPGSEKEKHKALLEEIRAMKGKFPKKFAKGGSVDMEASGYRAMPEEHEVMNAAAEAFDSKRLNLHGASEEGAGDMNHLSPIVRKIMMGRMRGYSEGGRVANDSDPIAEFMPNEFDELVLDGGEEFHYTGDNSGDHIGSEEEDERRKDVVSRIMASRRKKDRNPSPA